MFNFGSVLFSSRHSFFCASTIRVDVVLQEAVESGNKGVISFDLSLASLKSDHQRKMRIFS